MRQINKIIIHCTATPKGRDISIDDVRRWHTTPARLGGNGWADIGYHYLITLDGTICPGRPLDQPGAHCRGHNTDSVGVCYVGGLDAEGKNPEDTRTTAQRRALVDLLTRLKHDFPHATIRGHRDFAAKACPSFDATAEYAILKP